MIKQVTVTFDFEPETETVSNLTCFVDGVEKKKKTTRSVSKDKKDVKLEDEAIITLEANKLVFNNKCVADMEIEWQDRIVIKYEKFESSRPMPIIGKDLAFDEEGSGNKVTKTNTVSYRGKANTILKEYGEEFTIEPYKDGIWKLVTKAGGNENLTYEDVTDEAENLDITVITDEGHNEDTEINEMTFKF